MRPLVILLLLAVLVWATWALYRRAAAPQGPADDRVLSTLEIPDTAAARELLGRWRDRARRWRGVAVIPAVIVAVVTGLVLRGEVTFGLVNTVGIAPWWSDALVVGLLAAAVGAFGAELHHLRRRPIGPRSATLRPRAARELRRPLARVRRVVLLLITFGAFAFHAGAVASELARGTAWAAVAAMVVLLACEAVEHRVAARPRPALPPDLDRADDAVRELAVRSVDDAASGAALLLAGWSALGTAGALPMDTSLEAPLVLGTAAVIGWSAWWAWRSRPTSLIAEVTGRSTLWP